MSTEPKTFHAIRRSILAIVFLAITCLPRVSPAALTAGDADPATWPTEGWAISAPETRGFDSVRLAKGLEDIRAWEPNIHSLLIIRQGSVVLNAVFFPFEGGSLHDVASDTKSVTSTLIGIAVRKGLIRSLDQPLLDFFPERKVANLDERKKAITLRDLLTMRSGLECITEPTELTLTRMMASPDWVQYVLDLPMVARPGTKFAYNSAAFHLLSVIVRRVTGMTALDFARQELFGPLGIRKAIWPMDNQGISNHGWGDLMLEPEAMAKIGYLFLNKGAWDGKPIVTPDWVETATHERPEVAETDYGYLWWINSEGGFSARGRGGQYIIVFPDREMVVVTTGGGIGNVGRVVRDGVFPALLDTLHPLPPDPEGDKALKDKVEALAREPEIKPGPAAVRPATADRISGRTFVLEPNPFGISTMILRFPDSQAATLTVGVSDPEEPNPVFTLGIEGRYVIKPGRHGFPAAGRARWESADTILINVDEIGRINKFTIRLTFTADGFNGTMGEGTGLGQTPLRAKMK